MFKACLILFLGAFLCAAVLTPVVYSVLGAFLQPMPWPFSRVFSRVATISAFVLLYILRREFALHQLKAYFAPPTGSFIKNFATVLGGMALALLTTALLFPLVLTYGKVVWAGRSGLAIASKALHALAPALLIATPEEAFFRVVLFERFRKSVPPVIAACFVSAIYALLHFIAPIRQFVVENGSLTAGIDYLVLVIKRMFMPEVYPAMFGLFLVGMVLSYAIFKTRSVYLGLGLHAGWVIAVKTVSMAAMLAPGQSFAIGTEQRYYLVSTPAGWFGIILAGFTVAFLVRRRPGRFFSLTVESGSTSAVDSVTDNSRDQEIVV